MKALERWERELPGWGIPEEIIAAAPESPWGFPVGLFRTGNEPDDAGPSTSRAREAMPDEGTVLDVGVGGGAASLPLADLASLIVGVDPSEGMLDEFRQAGSGRGVRTKEVRGNWPDVAQVTPVTDLVLCHHVFYNVANLGPFARARRARAAPGRGRADRPTSLVLDERPLDAVPSARTPGRTDGRGRRGVAPRARVRRPS